MFPPSRSPLTRATIVPRVSLIISENVSRCLPGSPWSVAVAVKV
jgi:hypothetical protein